jgi:Tfp pilus assembly protein PilF
VAPGHPDALYALGITRIRQGRPGDGLDLLRRAAAARPESTRYALGYAAALHDTGKRARALRVLEAAHRRRPGDRQVLRALVDYHRERGDRAAAARYAERLKALGEPDGRADPPR